MSDILEQIQNDILSKYQSLDHPNFKFVNKCYNANIYKDVVACISEDLIIEDVTDINEDVSFSYILKGKNEKWLIMLSMVGNYALVFFMTTNNSTILIEKPKSNDEEKIFKILNRFEFKILNQNIIEKKIRLNLFDEKWPTVFRCLFSDEEI